MNIVPLSQDKLAGASPNDSTQAREEAVRRAISAKNGTHDIRGLFQNLALSPLRSDKQPPLGNMAESLEPQTQTSGDVQSKSARGDDFLGMSSQTHLKRADQVHNVAAESYPKIHARRAKRLRTTYNSLILLRARGTPLPLPTSDEDVFFQGHLTPMMEEELEEGRFHETPLDVEHGVAVLEESVELGVPDVVTQA